MSNTICVSQEGPANALALNKDCSQVVIAGRNVFKVFSIDNEFNEVCNLRVGKNLNLNFSSIDVAWSSIEENTLATAATNGAVVVWNLSRSGRSKQEHVFSDHKRTVNKVSFHLTEPALLISGSQDGMMKCFDLRMKEVARTFLSNTEPVRDVQFSPHSAHVFAAVSENGGVQLWDVRRAERCLHQFTAHSGPVFACDWHPEHSWLATASRDKTIKVWDIHGRPSLEYTIHTIASVGHIKWRPQRKYHIASCALVLDSSVNIWDVRRPWIPLATFDEHRDVTTAVAWAGEPDLFLSTSRDCTLYRHTFRDAIHPTMAANPHGVGIGPKGDITMAAAQHRAPPTPPSLADRLHTLIGRKHSTSSACGPMPTTTPSLSQPTAGLQQQQQLQLEATFHTSAASTMRWWTAQDNNKGGVAAFVACAKRYRIAGCLMSVCDHNAAVAKENGKYQVSLVWLVIKTIYASKASSPRQESASNLLQLSREDGSTLTAGTVNNSGFIGSNQGSGALSQDNPGYDGCNVDNADDRRLPRADQKMMYSGFQNDDDPETDDGSDHQFHNSGVLGFPTQNIHIPRANHAYYNNDNRNWLTARSAHFVDSSTQDWTLQGEAFILRSSAGNPHDGQSTNSSTFTENESALDHYDGHNPGQIHHPNAGNGISLTSGIQSASSSSLSNSPTTGLIATSNGGEDSLVCRYAAGAGGGEGWAAAAHVASALRLHADLGDIQTSVTVLLALGDLRNTLSGHLDEVTQEHWLVSYLELLGRHKLWDICTQIIQCAWLASISQLSQQSTTVHMSCGRCGRTLAPPTPSPTCPSMPLIGAAICERCGPPAPSTCSICHQVVRGLYSWCQGCSHGGHTPHIRDWLKENKQCPAGCGHVCEYN